MAKKIVRLNEQVLDFEGRNAGVTIGSILLRELEKMPVASNSQGGATQQDFDVAIKRRKIGRKIKKAMDDNTNRLDRLSDEEHRLVEEALMMNHAGWPTALMVQPIEAVRGISYEDADAEPESPDAPEVPASA